MRIREIIYHSLQPNVQYFFKGLYRLSMEGLDNLPKKGPYIIASKHRSFFDPPIIAAFVPPVIHWIVAKWVKTNLFFKPWCRLASCVTVNGSVGGALSLLKKDEVVGIFPEGCITCCTKLGKARSGVVVLAMKTAAPIVPCFVTEDTFRTGIGITLPKPFSTIKIVFGKPLSLPKFDGDIIPEQVLIENTQKVMESINSLAFEEIYYEERG